MNSAHVPVVTPMPYEIRPANGVATSVQVESAEGRANNTNPTSSMPLGPATAFLGRRTKKAHTCALQ